MPVLTNRLAVNRNCCSSSRTVTWGGEISQSAATGLRRSLAGDVGSSGLVGSDVSCSVTRRSESAAVQSESADVTVSDMHLKRSCSSCSGRREPSSRQKERCATVSQNKNGNENEDHSDLDGVRIDSVADSAYFNWLLDSKK